MNPEGWPTDVKCDVANPGSAILPVELEILEEIRPRKEQDREKFPEVKDIPNNTFIPKVVLGLNTPEGDETQ